MAGESQEPKAPAAPVETNVARDRAYAISMGEAGVDKPTAKEVPAEGVSAQFDTDGVDVKTGLGDDTDGVEEETLEEGGKDDGEVESPAADAAEPLPDLGEFKADDPEVVAKFDERYYTADQKLNAEALTTEFWANAKDGKAPALNESTYAYLQERLGISKEYAKDLEAAVVAKTQADQAQVYDRAGGQERLQRAVAWGKGGGYSEAQRDRFNKALASGDPEAVNDAVDALIARFERATGDKPARAPGKPGSRLPSSPARSATTDAKAAGVAGYENYTQYQKAFRAANDKVDGSESLNTVRKRLRASPWYKGGRG